MIVLLIILLIVFGFGGYRLGGPDYGPYSGVGTILLVLLILFLLGVLPSGGGLRLR